MASSPRVGAQGIADAAVARARPTSQERNSLKTGAEMHTQAERTVNARACQGVPELRGRRGRREGRGPGAGPDDERGAGRGALHRLRRTLPFAIFTWILMKS